MIQGTLSPVIYHYFTHNTEFIYRKYAPILHDLVMKYYRDAPLENYDDEKLEICIKEFEGQDFNDMKKTHCTFMMYDILKHMLLTVGVEGYIKKRIIILIDVIGGSKSIDLIKDNFFDVIIM
jgi:hypothetical protein